jgi:hypothetical protein
MTPTEEDIRSKQHTIKLRSDFWCDVYFDEED